MRREKHRDDRRSASSGSGNSVDRIARVNELLKREIADLIEQLGISGNCGTIISVTKVNCSSCLKHATVYISSLAEADERLERRIIDELYKAKSEIQYRMSRHVILKYTPVLSFTYDRNPTEGDKVLALLRELDDTESNENE